MKYIVVLQRGWVAVGDLTVDGDQCTLTNASVIRRWGTTAGLGELAAKGPLPGTILDPAGTVEFHVLTAILRIRCEETAWSR